MCLKIFTNFLHDLRFKFFSADRGGLGYIMGWQMQAGEYASGITIDSRKKWRIGLYSESKARYWDVATNLRRWENICM